MPSTLPPALTLKRERTLLCIDDEVEGLVLRKAFFELFGYRVLTARGGAEGLKILARQPVDGVILDYCMPGMNGGQVAQEIRRTRPALPVIMLCGYPWEVPQAIASQVSALAAKGDPPDHLMALIEQFVGKLAPAARPNCLREKSVRGLRPSGGRRAEGADRRIGTSSTAFPNDRRKFV